MQPPADNQAHQPVMNASTKGLNMSALSAPLSRTTSASSASSQGSVTQRGNQNSANAAETMRFGDRFSTSLSHASELLNADNPQGALALLAPHAQTATAQSHYGFQSRMGVAHMGVVDKLVAANRLGACAVTPDAHGDWLKSTVNAERISCYVGVIAAYGQMLKILQQPQKRAEFIEKNSEAVLAEVEAGAAAGMHHASLECDMLFTKIFQVNSNKASQGFMARALENGLLSEHDPMVQSFREVQAAPLFDQIAAATQPLYEAAEAHEQPAQLFFMAWLSQQKQTFSQREELALLR